MTELRKTLAEAISGRGRLVLVAGEPGIGKTRLTEELGSEARAESAQVESRAETDFGVSF